MTQEERLTALEVQVRLLGEAITAQQATLTKMVENHKTLVQLADGLWSASGISKLKGGK